MVNLCIHLITGYNVMEINSQVEQEQPIVTPPFKRNWGKIVWTGDCTKGEAYIGCTKEEYEEWIEQEKLEGCPRG